MHRWWLATIQDTTYIIYIHSVSLAPSLLHAISVCLISVQCVNVCAFSTFVYCIHYKIVCVDSERQCEWMNVDRVSYSLVVNWLQITYNGCIGEQSRAECAVCKLHTCVLQFLLIEKILWWHSFIINRLCCAFSNLHLNTNKLSLCACMWVWMCDSINAINMHVILCYTNVFWQCFDGEFIINHFNLKCSLANEYYLSGTNSLCSNFTFILCYLHVHAHCTGTQYTHTFHNFYLQRKSHTILLSHNFDCIVYSVDYGSPHNFTHVWIDFVFGFGAKYKELHPHNIYVCEVHTPLSSLIRKWCCPNCVSGQYMW